MIGFKYVIFVFVIISVFTFYIFRNWYKKNK